LACGFAFELGHDSVVNIEGRLHTAICIADKVIWLRPFQTNSETAAILVDEFDAGGFQGPLERIDPTLSARALWVKTHPLPTIPDKSGIAGATTVAVLGTDRRIATRDRSVGKPGPSDKTKPIVAADPQ